MIRLVTYAAPVICISLAATVFLLVAKAEEFLGGQAHSDGWVEHQEGADRSQRSPESSSWPRSSRERHPRKQQHTRATGKPIVQRPAEPSCSTRNGSRTGGHRCG